MMLEQTATDAGKLLSPPPSLDAPILDAPTRLKTGTANACMMRVLERIALRFEAEGVEVMALKGGALSLTVHLAPGERPMSDLDLMVRPEHATRATEILEDMGFRPGRPQVRSDFFPRFYYEREFVFGDVFPVIVDLHARPFRPLRYARRIPADAFWQDATYVRVGCGRVLVPSVEDMLIHLAAHSAIHANVRPLWLCDLKRWVDAWEGEIDWRLFAEHAEAWGLVLPVRSALAVAEERLGAFCPGEVRERLNASRVGWRDRLALRHAPRDADHPTGHVLVNAVCTPGVTFVAAYLAAALLPNRRHMAEWYDRRHWGWLPLAHAMRLSSPLLRRFTGLWGRFFKIELQPGVAGGVGVFAARVLASGERVGSFGEGDDAGKLRYVRHSCRPNTRLRGRRLYAIRAMDVDEELTVDRGPDACACRRRARTAEPLAKSA